jgi:hypothetical protein
MLAFMSACDPGQSGSNTSTTSGARTSPPAQAVACATSSVGEIAKWTVYVNRKYAYCLRYPASWYRPPDTSDPNPDFSSDAVGTPEALSENGMWLSVWAMSTALPMTDCWHANVRDYTFAQTATTLDGAPSVRYDGGRLVIVNAWRDRCYSFWFVVGRPAANRHVMELIFDSFRFAR